MTKKKGFVETSTPDSRFSAALDQQLQELDVQQSGVMDRVELIVALESNSIRLNIFHIPMHV